MKLFLSVGILLISVQMFFAQEGCTGTTVFTAQKCSGDEVNSAEQELFRIINEYRAQNKLPPVVLSDSLSFVANRHLLDLTLNVKSLTHSWSNCPYDVKKQDSWNCLFEAPQRLKTNYAGQGYENLYRNLTGDATPAAALEAWKKSPKHNILILNLEIWKNTKFDGLGIAVSGNYAAIWFGSNESSQMKLGKNTKGLGVSYAKMVEGLTNILTIEKEASLEETDKWVGKSADNSIILEIYADEKEITETEMALSVKLENNIQLSPQGRTALSQFLKNIAPNWKDRDKWMDETLLLISKTPTGVRTLKAGKRTMEVRLKSKNYLTVEVRKSSKPVAKEL
jgi:uncharacterized protein YkwD